MPYINFNSAKPGLKILITGMSVITIGVITFFAGLLVSRLIFSLHLDDLNHIIFGRFERLSNWQLKTYQVFQTLGFFVLPGFFLYWLFSSPTTKYFNLSVPRNNKAIFWTIVAMFASIPVVAWLVNLSQIFHLPDYLGELETSLKTTDEHYNLLSKRLLSGNNIGHLIFNILMIAILPAIGEEMIFRGVIQKIGEELFKKTHWAVIVTALLFSMVHGQFFGLLPRFLMGAFLGYIMVWCRNIWIPIIGHFVFNLIAVIAQYLFLHGMVNISMDGHAIGGAFGLSVLASSFLAGISAYFIRKSASVKSTRVD